MQIMTQVLEKYEIFSESCKWNVLKCATVRYAFFNNFVCIEWWWSQKFSFLKGLCFKQSKLYFC